MQQIELDHYHDLLSYGQHLIGNRKLSISNYDLVHTAISEGYQTKEKIKALFYEEIVRIQFTSGDPIGKNFGGYKICIGCPNEGPQPIASFYLHTKQKSAYQYVDSYCKECSKKRDRIYKEKNKQTLRYKELRKKYNSSYAQKNKTKESYKNMMNNARKKYIIANKNSEKYKKSAAKRSKRWYHSHSKLLSDGFMRTYLAQKLKIKNCDITSSMITQKRSDILYYRKTGKKRRNTIKLGQNIYT